MIETTPEAPREQADGTPPLAVISKDALKRQPGLTNGLPPGQGAAATRPASHERAPAHARQRAVKNATRLDLPSGLKAYAGKLVLVVCPNGQSVCSNVNCRLQPFCACARAENASANKAESRIWFGLACCAAGLIVVALFWALLSFP